MKRWDSRAIYGTVVALVVCAAAGGIARSQDMPGAVTSTPPGAPSTPPGAPSTPPGAPEPNPTAQAPQAPAQPAPGQPSPAQPAAQKFSSAQIDQLAAPIALYPDPLLSQVLMASTYPLEVVEAAHWVHEPANKSLTGDALAAALKNQNWDPSVMALVPFPRVLGVMADRVQWTEQLGNAFLAQQNDVMAAVQRLRHAALAAGGLKATPECHCIIQTTGDQIAILPSEPKVVCIPVYDPRYVYGTWWEPAYPPIVFPPPVGFAYAPGLWIGFEPPMEVAVFGPLWGWGWFDWGGGRIVVDNTVFGRLDPNRAAFVNGTWVHDPAHRRGVAYANAGVASRFGGGQAPANVAATHGAATFGSRAAAQAAAGRFGAAQAARTVNGPGRGFANHAGAGAFHGNAVAHGAGPQIARGHTAPAHLSPGGGPHAAVSARGPVGGGGPHGGPGAAARGGGPGGGGHHH